MRSTKKPLGGLEASSLLCINSGSSEYCLPSHSLIGSVYHETEGVSHLSQIDLLDLVIQYSSAILCYTMRNCTSKKPIKSGLALAMRPWLCLPRECFSFHHGIYKHETLEGCDIIVSMVLYWQSLFQVQSSLRGEDVLVLLHKRP